MSSFSAYRLPSGHHGLGPELVAENQRWRLIGAGVEIFAEYGYIGATSRLIAGRAAVSSSTFFANFDSVPALLQACFEVAAGSVTELVSRPCRTRSDRHLNVEASIEAALAFSASEPGLALEHLAAAAVSVAIERVLIGATDRLSKLGPELAQLLDAVRERALGESKHHDGPS